MPLGGFSPCPLPLGGTTLDGLTAEQHARLAADLVACVKTSPLALLNFVISPGPDITDYHSQYGLGLSYAPSFVVNGSGDITFTWEPAYEDEYNNIWPINIRHIDIQPRTTFSARFGTAEITGTNSARIRMRNVAGTLTSTNFFAIVY